MRRFSFCGLAIYAGRDYTGARFLAVAGAPDWFKFGDWARVGTVTVRRLI